MYLGVLRFAGIGVGLATLVTVWSAIIFIGHVLGREKGAIIAIIGTAIVVASFRVSMAPPHPWMWAKVTYFVIVWFILSSWGFFAYLVGYGVMCVVDLMDAVGRKSRPPDP